MQHDVPTPEKESGQIEEGRVLATGMPDGNAEGECLCHESLTGSEVL